MDLFVDHARTKDHAWSLSKEQIRVYGQSKIDSDPSSRIPVQSLSATFSPALGHLLYGGLDIVHRMRLRLERVDEVEGGWRAVFSKPDAQPEQRYVLEYSGLWDGRAQRGFVERITYLEQAYMPRYKGARHEYFDWHQDPQTGLWVAGEMSLITSGGVKERSLFWEPPCPVPETGGTPCWRFRIRAARTRFAVGLPLRPWLTSGPGRGVSGTRTGRRLFYRWQQCPVGSRIHGFVRRDGFSLVCWWWRLSWCGWCCEDAPRSLNACREEGIHEKATDALRRTFSAAPGGNHGRTMLDMQQLHARVLLHHSQTLRDGGEPVDMGYVNSPQPAADPSMYALCIPQGMGSMAPPTFRAHTSVPVRCIPATAAQKVDAFLGRRCP
jgi:hypothetical protein